MANLPKMNYYSPLFKFYVDYSDSFEKLIITRYLSIEAQAYTLTGLDREEFLSDGEIREISLCHYWIKINNYKPKDLSPSEILNLLTMAFWVFAPTTVHLRYKFGDGDGQEFMRMLDRFQFHGVDFNKTDFNKKDLREISKFYSSLVRVQRKSGRLQTALQVTFLGAISFNWKTAFVLYSAAFEALLTYSRDPGITKRLSKSFACLVETNKRRRNAAYKKFKKLYELRSDIMHGRESLRSRSKTNLKNLASLAALLRKLWQVVLTNQGLIEVLEKDDSHREKGFKKIESGYTPSHP